ncbi:vitamin B12-dependent ribonucleotide reductase [Candidatus Pacearchaeota archaeon]|nr:MAG: vitamin B12-dependent ribonucleotide reductase [Candidatus Pacearchaeota archaeon]
MADEFVGLGNVVGQGKSEVVERGRVLGMTYSPLELKEFDPTRHVSYEEALQLVSSSGLQREKLLKAVEEGSIRVYEFKENSRCRGGKYLDRIDIGRVYYVKPSRITGIKVEPYFSRGLEDPLEAAGPYKTMHLELKDTKGNVVFKMDDALFPEEWEEGDALIVAQKYFYRPNSEEQKEAVRKVTGSDYERSLADLIRRVSLFFAKRGFELGYFDSKESAENFRRELEALQIERKLAFNSPTNFNAGIYDLYGIEGSKEEVFIRGPDGRALKVSQGEYVNPQCHACFILGLRDSLEGILENCVNEGKIFRSGSGVGSNIGALREKDALLSGGGKSSGPISFLEVFDKSAGSIKSGGKSRRAARMTVMESSHPDILDFVGLKVREDRKMLTLLQAGYSGGMEGEAASTVGMQNTNISVRMKDEDFEKALNGGKIQLRSVVDGSIVGEVDANQLLKRISFAAWRCGDPGIQYEDRIQEMHTCKNSGRQNATNPCSEYLFLDNTSCNLASLNLTRFCDGSGMFDIEAFKRAVRLSVIAQDIANNAASYPVREIAQISPEFATIGIGYANLGDLLMRRGIPYDSEKGRSLAASITALMTGEAYKASAELAKGLGPFVHFEFNRAPMLEVIRKHKGSLDDIVEFDGEIAKIKEAAEESWTDALEAGERYGYRNAQASAIAPTGTISFLMGCSTTGIEPSYSLRAYKSLSGGGTIPITTRGVPVALKNLGYSREEIEDILEYISKNDTVVGAPHIRSEHVPVFDTAVGDGRGRGTLSFESHIRMLGAVQPFVSGAISKTNNLPQPATVKDVYEGFVLGHRLGLKALAIFRENSKPLSALSLGDKSFKKFERGEKEDLPACREAVEWEVNIGGFPLHVVVSEYPDGRPGQLAFLAAKSGSSLKGLLDSMGILVSKALKRGVKLEDLIDSWRGQEMEPKGIVSGHPYIKTALSPLDFACKLLSLEYFGRVEEADKKDEVRLEDLRGYKNGFIKLREREKLDEWSFEDVISDPLLGGFVEEENPREKGNGTVVILNNKENKCLANGGGNKRGIFCSNCGRLMKQISPNCYVCSACGDKYGGCGI